MTGDTTSLGSGKGTRRGSRGFSSCAKSQKFTDNRWTPRKKKTIRVPKDRAMRSMHNTRKRDSGGEQGLRGCVKRAEVTERPSLLKSEGGEKDGLFLVREREKAVRRGKGGSTIDLPRGGVKKSS